MSDESSPKSNKTLLFVGIALVVALVGYFAFSTFSTLQSGDADTSKDAAMYIGLQRVPPKTMHTLFPDGQGKPMLIEFTSPFCIECKKMTPLVDKVVKANPTLVFHKLDIQKDKQSAPQVFEAFKPTIAPVLIFVNGQGEIHNVLYGDHNQDEIEAGLDGIDLQSQKGA